MEFLFFEAVVLTDNCFNLCLGVYDEPDLSDITTGSPVGAQDSQLALADPLKNTDAATSAPNAAQEYCLD